MIKIIIPLAIILLCGLVSKAESYRLPTNLRPQRYKLEILTHLSDKDGYKFYGKEWIRVSLKINQFINFCCLFTFHYSGDL